MKLEDAREFAEDMAIMVWLFVGYITTTSALVLAVACYTCYLLDMPLQLIINFLGGF